MIDFVFTGLFLRLDPLFGLLFGEVGVFVVEAISCSCTCGGDEKNVMDEAELLSSCLCPANKKI